MTRRYRQLRTGLVVLLGAGLVLYDGVIWFLCFLVALSAISLWVMKIRHESRLHQERLDLELERAHHQETEYDWRPWAKPDYREHRRR